MPRSRAHALAILDESVAYFGQDPEERRAVFIDTKGNSGGEFISPDGTRKCIVGRFLVDPRGIMETHGITSTGGLLSKFGKDRFDEFFRPGYDGFPPDFYTQLERLHDNEANWDENGLTETGLGKVVDIETWIREHLPDHEELSRAA